MPSQPQRSLRRDFGYSGKCRRFRRLAAKSPVSGEEIRASRTEGGKTSIESLLGDFSISEIWTGSRRETGCVSAETGSNPRSKISGGVFISSVEAMDEEGPAAPVPTSFDGEPKPGGGLRMRSRLGRHGCRAISGWLLVIGALAR